MKNKVLVLIALAAVLVISACSSGGRFQINDPYDRGAPVYYSAPATLASPCGN